MESTMSDDSSGQEFTFEDSNNRNHSPAVKSDKSKPPKKKIKKEAIGDDDSNDDDNVPLRRIADAAKLKKKVKPDPAASSAAARKKDTTTKKRKHQPSKENSSSSSKPTKNKKVKTEATPLVVKSGPSLSGNNGSSKPRELKKLDKAERLQYAMQSFLWWDAQEPPPGCQWVTMEHVGVCFPEPYVPHHVKIRYDDQEISLTPVQEEAATFFAAMDPEGMQLGNPKTAKIFIKNFFDDFRQLLGKKHVVKEFKKCDFESIRRHLNEQKIIRKAMSDVERKAKK
jgi:DNA topoisomerase I